MTSLWVLLLPAVAVFVCGYLTAAAVFNLSRRDEYEHGWRDALHALGSLHQDRR